MPTPTARDLMTPGPAACVPGDAIETAARLMAAHDCGALPVVDDPRTRHPVGVITDRDIVVRLVAHGRSPGECQVKEAMTPNPLVLHENASFHDCAQAMMRHWIRRILVVDDRGQLAGIITDGDLARACRRDPGLEHDLAAMVEEVSTPARHPSGPPDRPAIGTAAYLSRPDHPPVE